MEWSLTAYSMKLACSWVSFAFKLSSMLLLISQIPHVGFFATKDIEPMEELCYLRTDQQVSRQSGRNCSCGLEGCMSYL